MLKNRHFIFYDLLERIRTNYGSTKCPHKTGTGTTFQRRINSDGMHFERVQKIWAGIGK